MAGDNAKKSEKLPQLEWQSELDSTMSEIDNRLTHPRRRATDAPQPTLQGLNEMTLTTEIMDEIAWRVAEELRRREQLAAEGAPTTPVSAAAIPPPARPRPPAQSKPVPPPPAVDPLRPGKMLMIRYRMPSMPWPFRLLFRRRKQHPLTTVKLRA